MSRACFCICVSPFLWFFLILTVRNAGVFSTLTTSLSPSANLFFFFFPNSHLHCSPPRLTILFSVSIISEVFSLDTDLTSRLHCNKYSYYSPSVFLSLRYPLSLFFLFLPLGFLPRQNVRELTGPQPFSVARPQPPLVEKERLQWQALVSHWAAALIRPGNHIK